MHTEDAQCRVNMHAWAPEDVERRGRYYLQTLRCGRCGSGKLQWIHSRTGLVARTAYRYRSGYRRRGQGRLTAEQRGLLRLHTLYGAFGEDL